MLPFLPTFASLLGKGLLAAAAAFSARQAAQIALPFGIKALRRFIDRRFRPKVRPLPGSVVFTDLISLFEHSGIYDDDGQIINLAVTGLAESGVVISDPAAFTSKSLSDHIYVSCDSRGRPVGDERVRTAALSRVGERAFYGLVFKNCHAFTARCLEAAPLRGGEAFRDWLDANTELSFAILKNKARERLNAVKWLLWDRSADETEEDKEEAFSLSEMAAFLEQAPIDEAMLRWLAAERVATQAYAEEIADEPIPASALELLTGYRRLLDEALDTYEKVRPLLALCPTAGWNLGALRRLSEDFAALAFEMQHNPRIRELTRQLGRDYRIVSEQRRVRVPRPSRTETYGVHCSDDLARLLPSEMVCLEDEMLELLFYARLAEKRLLTYELGGITSVPELREERRNVLGGPIIACLDTSGSMSGKPLLRAKALLLAIANILVRERRSLHVLLFGAAGEIAEQRLDDANGIPSLLDFLRQGYGGGTDFETPLQKALEIINRSDDFQRADILLITDGECAVSDDFAHRFTTFKASRDVLLWTVLCDGKRKPLAISDQSVTL